MAKLQLIALGAISVFSIILTFMVKMYHPQVVFLIFLGLFLLSICGFLGISVASIFKSIKLVKQKDKETLVKSARLVKTGAIFFWILQIFAYSNAFLIGREWFFFLGFLYLLLLGTSVFSIAYIRLLLNENEINKKRALIFTLLQFWFVVDIISILLIKPVRNEAPYASIKEKDNRNAAQIAKYYLGTYTPPEFLFVLIRAFKAGPVPKFVKKAKEFIIYQWTAKRIRCYAAIAFLCLIPVGIISIKFIQSRMPVPINVSFNVTPPDTTGNPEQRRPLSVRFLGSASTVEMMDKEVPAGKITINPPVAGTWKWEGDNVLVFSAQENWQIGARYTVTFAKRFFPGHIKVNKNFNFRTEDFELNVSQREFYIDPADGSIRRALFTIRANYPVDIASLERNIRIEPNIAADSGSLKKQIYQFTMSNEEENTIIYIVTEPLGMPARNERMHMTVAEGVRDASGSVRTTRKEIVSVEIPGMSTYARVIDMTHELVKNEMQVFDQVLIMNTQGTVEPEELAKNISAWELPVNMPAIPGLFAANENHHWNNVEVVPEILNLSRRVNLVHNPNELRFSSLNSWKFDAQPGRYIYVRLSAGTRFFGGFILAETFDTVIRLGEFPKELEILSQGSILAFSGDRRLAIMSRGVREVDFEIGRIRPDDINHLISQTYGDIGNINFLNYNFNQYNITEQYRSSASVPVASDQDIGYFSFDFSRYLENIPDRNLRHGFFIFTVKSKDGEISARRLIIITDLGFFVKTSADSSRDVFVQSIASGNPVEGASVQVLGLNGNPIFSGTTDSGGRARIPSFGPAFRNERAPVVYTVRTGEDMSFMAFNASGRNLDYSSFDVGGIHGAADPRTLNSFVFSDRGIYRPGDEVRFGLVVKSGDWTVNTAGTPLEFKVTDPRGAEIFNRRIRLSNEGIEDVRFTTQNWSPTGVYTASVYFIREVRQGNELRETHVFLGSETVRVEEFLPDTLNVTAVFDPPPQDGWISPGELKARVTVKNLFGTAAVGNEVKAQIGLVPGHQYFRQYRDYTFRDPYQTRNNYEEFLGSINTDAGGVAQFDINLSKFERATYRLDFYSEAFEKGSGRNVSAQTAVFVSPLPYLVGYKADGNLSYINQNDVRVLNFIAINPQTQRSAVNDLTLAITELRYVSALVREPSGVYKYQSIQKEYPVLTRQISIPASGFDYRLPTNNPGNYKISIIGLNELEFNSIYFSVAGTVNVQRSLNRTAQLEITLNKNDFRNGEEIQLMIKAPYAGSGLITIERDRVYAYRWFTSSTETSIQRITVPSDLEGNAYINVQYLRSQSSPEIFMTPLSYGAVPFSISLENRTNRINLNIPAEAKPGEDFVIRYSTPQRGKIIVYAVDEGILQMASYRTPDPLSFFFRKRALEVRTAQILDMVLPGYSVLQSLAAMGGGGGYDELSRNLNPFRRRQNVPVAYWSGIVDSGPETRELRYMVPDHFNGTLRVMAVAVNNSAVGANDDRSLVRSAFVISPNVPMRAAPGDEFDISVTVTNLQRGAGENGRVRLTVFPSEHLTITGNTEFDLQIAEGRDHTLTIPVKAAGPLGGAQIRFSASNNNETSQLSAFLSVRPAVPYRVSLYTGVIRNRSAEVTIDRNVYEEFHTRSAALSYLPMGLAKGLSFFLSTFPYGCSEQLVSQAFPFLYPQLFRDLGFSRTEANESIANVISALQARIKENGAIGIWTPRSHDDPLLTVYAAHFLTEAEKAGHFVPNALMQRILQACRNIAEGSNSSLYDLTTRSYAIYVLTLNEIITTRMIESLKRDMSRNSAAETGLAGLYLAGSYAMLQRTTDATAMLSMVTRTMARNDSYRYIDELMYHAVYLNIVSRHFPSRLRDISENLLTDMASQMERRAYTTLSANHALMAIDSYMKAVPTAVTGRFAVQEILKNNQRRDLAPSGTTLFTVPFSAEAAKISLENRDNLNLFYQITAAGFDRELPAAEIKNGIEVFREFLDESGRTASSFKIGDIVTVRINFRSLGNSEYRDVAIVDLIPAGLETEIDSIRNRAGNSWSPDYVDIREDRIVIYGTVTNRVSSFTYRARAVNSGVFTTPPLFAEALYDKSVWAIRPQSPVRVSK